MSPVKNEMNKNVRDKKLGPDNSRDAVGDLSEFWPRFQSQRNGYTDSFFALLTVLRRQCRAASLRANSCINVNRFFVEGGLFSFQCFSVLFF
jgi:hypothetical protein